jgi:hypothetical protein
MEVLQAGNQVFKVANRHSSNVTSMLSRSDFGSHPGDAVMLNHEVQLMGSLWQLAASLVKDLTEPLKSIVNK